MELALGVALEFYAGVAKKMKLNVRRFWELISTFVEVTEEKLSEVFLASHVLNSVKLFAVCNACYT